jgi:hypothetical protein
MEILLFSVLIYVGCGSGFYGQACFKADLLVVPNESNAPLI